MPWSPWHDLTHLDRVLNNLPLSHINGQVIATIAPFVSGGSIVAPIGFSASKFWDHAVRFKCTWLLNAAARGAEHFLRCAFAVRHMAPLPPIHHLAFERRFSNPVTEAMGMREAASVVFCNPMQPRPRKTGSVGLPCNVDARIVAAAGKTLADRQIGEIIFRGSQLMAAYCKAPEETKSTIDDAGYMHAGDLGYRDADGYFFVTGRIKELINKGGENIAPREIDEALFTRPAVLDAAVVGVPDPYYGQDILTAVVLKAGSECSQAELRAIARPFWAATRLLRFSVSSANSRKDCPERSSGSLCWK
jgi:acyl-CoA synthetase (AMP-forming)/AMP-acid ligase II